MINGINTGMILGYILAGLGLAAVMGIVGLVFWYVKVRPDFEYIKADLAKKAAAGEVERIRLDLERKRADEERIKAELERKQEIKDCDLLRKGCQPLLIQEIKHLTEKVDGLTEKLDKWLDSKVYDEGGE